jgi:hypothetical protein
MSVEPSGIEQAVVELLRGLPVDRQRQVLDFAEFLRQRHGLRRPRQSVRGLWADLNVDVTEEDIAEARREMWGGFPREIPDGD